MPRRYLIFPLFNALVGVIIGAAVGYYLFAILAGILWGAFAGFSLALLLEFLLRRLGPQNWLYQRRVLMTVLLEIPFAILVIAPYAYAYQETRPEPRVMCCVTPLDYGAETYEAVTVPSVDGVTLAGWYVPPQTPPGPVIILLHGARGDRRGSAWHAARLIEAGYGVLLYDQRGLGESTGDIVSLGTASARDLLAAFDWIEARADAVPGQVGVVGLSGGGHIALNAAYLAPDRFPALWLDGVGAQQMADFPQAQNAGEQFATFINQRLLDMIEFRLGEPIPPPYTEILKGPTQPRLMLVAGGLEDFEKRVNQQYMAVVNKNTEVWVIEGAYHVGGPNVIPDEYAARMLAFFTRTFNP